MMSSETEILNSLAQTCRNLYSPTLTPTQRTQLHTLLLQTFPTFTTDIPDASINSTTPNPFGFNIKSPWECAVYLKNILNQAMGDPFLVLFLVTRLKEVVAGHYAIWSKEQKMELRSFILNYLYTHPQIPNTLQFTELFALMTKIGWFDVPEFQSVLQDISKFLYNPDQLLPSGYAKSISSSASSQSPIHHHLAFWILQVLVQEMNSQTPAVGSTSRNRKIAVHFRDQVLLALLQLGLNALRDALERQKSNAVGENDFPALQIVTLIKNCISFDFIGTNPDESIEDITCIQIPSSWRTTIKDTQNLGILLDSYKTFNPPVSSTNMEILSMLASTRRSLFNDEERKQFLTWLMTASKQILVTEVGLNHESSYHEFCRLLARLKSVHQISDLVENGEYADWISLVRGFTQKSFRAANVILAGNSQHGVSYLLVFWQKMVATLSGSSSYSSASPSWQLALEGICSEIAMEFVVAGLEARELQVKQPKSLSHASLGEANTVDGENDEEDDDDDDLDELFQDEEALLNTLENFAQIARVQYEPVAKKLMTWFDALATEYRMIVEQIKSNSQMNRGYLFAQKRSLEGKFTWLVYVIASAVGGRTAYQSLEEHDMADGDLACRIFHLMKFLHESKSPTASTRYLELAILAFLHKFRSSYIGEQAQRATKVYQNMSEAFGISDQEGVLNFIVSKIAFNLSNYPNNAQIIASTIKLLHELSTGYSSVKIMRKTPSSQHLLTNHFISAQSFLQSPLHSKSRGQFYGALGRLLFANEDTIDSDFYAFTKYWSRQFHEMSLLPSVHAFRVDSVRVSLENLFRDLRGFIESCSSKKPYQLFFDWFYPFIPVFLRAFEANVDHRVVGVCLLKFWTEFCLNRQMRCCFDISSANGVLLFRETSKVVDIYVKHTVARPLLPNTDVYDEKYKGYIQVFKILGQSFSGKYICFGVFELYGDRALVSSMENLFAVLGNVPLSVLLSYPKFSLSFFNLIEILASSEQLFQLPFIPDAVFDYIFQGLLSGVGCTSNTEIVSQTCFALEFILSFVFRSVTHPSVLDIGVVENGNNNATSLIDMARMVLASGGGGSTDSLASTTSSTAVRATTTISVRNNAFLNKFMNWSVPLVERLMKALLSVILFEDTPSGWAISRPLWVCILLDRPAYIRYMQNLVSHQLPERMEAITKSLSTLTEDDNTPRNLSSKSRDKFTSSVLAFRRELMAMHIPLIAPPGA